MKSRQGFVGIVNALIPPSFMLRVMGRMNREESSLKITLKARFQIWTGSRAMVMICFQINWTLWINFFRWCHSLPRKLAILDLTKLSQLPGDLGSTQWRVRWSNVQQKKQMWNIDFLLASRFECSGGLMGRNIIPQSGSPWSWKIMERYPTHLNAFGGIGIDLVNLISEIRLKSKSHLIKL